MEKIVFSEDSDYGIEGENVRVFKLGEDSESEWGWVMAD